MFIILNLECIRYEYKYIYIRPPKSKPNFCPTPAESGATPVESGATPAESGATPAESGATPAESGDSFRNQWGTEKYWVRCCELVELPSWHLQHIQK